MHQKLQQLLDSGEFDWDNIFHREAFLRAWVKGEISGRPAGNSSVERPSEEHSETTRFYPQNISVH